MLHITLECNTLAGRYTVVIVAILYDSNISKLKHERMKEKMGSKSAVVQNLGSEDNNDSCIL